MDSELPSTTVATRNRRDSSAEGWLINLSSYLQALFMLSHRF